MISKLFRQKKFLFNSYSSLINLSIKKYGDTSMFNLPYAYNELSLLFEQPTPYTCELIFNNLEQLNAANYKTTLII